MWIFLGLVVAALIFVVPGFGRWLIGLSLTAIACAVMFYAVAIYRDYAEAPARVAAMEKEWREIDKRAPNPFDQFDIAPAQQTRAAGVR